MTDSKPGVVPEISPNEVIEDSAAVSHHLTSVAKATLAFGKLGKLRREQHEYVYPVENIPHDTNLSKAVASLEPGSTFHLNKEGKQEVRIAARGARERALWQYFLAVLLLSAIAGVWIL